MEKKLIDAHNTIKHQIEKDYENYLRNKRIEGKIEEKNKKISEEIKKKNLKKEEKFRKIMEQNEANEKERIRKIREKQKSKEVKSHKKEITKLTPIYIGHRYNYINNYNFDYDRIIEECEDKRLN